MGDSAGRSACIIHFDGKFGPQKRLSNETLKTICLRREEWLALPENECHDNQKNIANHSFEFIPDHVQDIQELQEPAFYHMSCYRSFTDVTKLQRAKNSTEKRISAGLTQNIKPENEDTEDSGPKEKIRRSRRPRDQNGTNDVNISTRKSSLVLPECCLICKEPGPIYVTDPVSILFNEMYMRF
jgi:hypothetical protein